MNTQATGEALAAPRSAGFGHVAVAGEDTPAGRLALAWAVHEATVNGAALTICGSFARPVDDLAVTVRALAEPAREDRIDEVAASGDPVGALVGLPTGATWSSSVPTTRRTCSDAATRRGSSPSPGAR